MTVRDLALMIIDKNPNIANNPNAQEWIRAIRENDAVAGERIATNICNTYGITKEDALSQATSFAQNMLNGGNRG